jgi:5,10-methylenetetrahydromethanopterin reductase
MADLELSCGLPPGPDFADLAVLAEELGYARVWIYDSAPLWEDPFVHLALAAQRTTRIGLSTAVLIPDQRSVMAMASGIATLARLSGGRFRACFGTGFTARLAVGQRPMTLSALADYVTVLRHLLAGKTATVDGRSARMLHAAGLTEPRPIDVPLWVSVFGPRGAELAGRVADGIIGPPHPTLPAAMILSGTVLDPGEDPGSDRVREAIGPWRVVDWHNAYAKGGAEEVDALPGGRAWREALEALAPRGRTPPADLRGPRHPSAGPRPRPAGAHRPQDHGRRRGPYRQAARPAGRLRLPRDRIHPDRTRCSARTTRVRGGALTSTARMSSSHGHARAPSCARCPHETDICMTCPSEEDICVKCPSEDDILA